MDKFQIFNNYLKRFLFNLRNKPRYTLMRSLARFSLLRKLVVFLKHIKDKKHLESHKSLLMANLDKSLFKEIDCNLFVQNLERDGVAFGLKLPEEVVNKIIYFAQETQCYADRANSNGFRLKDKLNAEKTLGKPILLAQYFNTAENCNEIQQLVSDPLLNLIACHYIGAMPCFVGANLWWTFAVDASDEEKKRHAHFFHRDVDDFRFFKFFFYLTDLSENDGAHFFVKYSHKLSPPRKSFMDKWNFRRYSDQEVFEHYQDEDILEIIRSAGHGFAENTFGIHKGTTPTQKPRLLLQLQFSLFDYGVMNDKRAPSQLKSLISN